MAGLAYKYLAFLAVFHVLAFQAQSAGLMAQETPDNSHKKFVDKISDDNLTEKTSVKQDAGIVQDTFSPVLAMTDFLNTVVGVLVSPYSAIQATVLPGTFKMLISALTGVTEMYVAYKFVRGGA